MPESLSMRVVHNACLRHRARDLYRSAVRLERKRRGRVLAPWTPSNEKELPSADH